MTTVTCDVCKKPLSRGSNLERAVEYLAVGNGSVKLSAEKIDICLDCAIRAFARYVGIEAKGK